MANPRAVQVSLAIGSGSNSVFLQNINQNQMVQMNHKRFAGEQGNQLTAVFSDKSAFDLETKLLFLGNSVIDRSIYYQYGYSYSLGSMSRLYSGFIYDYNPSISGNIISLEIMAVSKESSTMTNTKAVTYSNGQTAIRISEVVKRIAVENNWILGQIEETKPIKRTLINSFLSPMEFINSELVPYAISALTGNGFYAVYFTTNIRGNTVINFKSMMPSASVNGTFTYLGKTNEFTYNSPLSTIISWSPTSIGSYLLWGGGFTETNTMTSSYGDTYTSRSAQLVNPAGGSNKTWLSRNNFSQLYMSSADPDEADSAVKAVYSKAASMQYNANCTMIGDVNRQVGETLEFNIILQNRVHYSSGKYLVLGVEDSISTSGFTTNLSLVKNASYAGTIQNYVSYLEKTG